MNKSEKEQKYIKRISLIANLYGGGTFLLFSCASLVVISTFVWDRLEILTIYIVITMAFLLIMPFLFSVIEPEGFGIWMDWSVNDPKIRVIYYMMFGGIIGPILMVPALSFLFGFQFLYIINLVWALFPLLFGIVIIYFIGEYKKKEDRGKRFMMIRIKMKIVQDAVDKALISLDLKSKEEWVGSKWNGHFVHRIVGHPIQYNIEPGLIFTTIKIKDETEGSIPITSNIERAISLQLGIS